MKACFFKPGITIRKSSNNLLVFPSDFSGVTSPWEIKHLFVSGINIAPAAQDSVYIVQADGLTILKTKETVKINSKVNDLGQYSNPGSEFFTATIKVKKGGLASIKLIGSNGKSEEISIISLPSGDSFIPLNISGKPSCLYQIRSNGHFGGWI